MTLSQYNCCSGTLQWKKNKICVESEKIQWDSALGQNSYGHGSALVCLLTRPPSHTTEQSPELSLEVFWGPLFVWKMFVCALSIVFSSLWANASCKALSTVWSNELYKCNNVISRPNLCREWKDVLCWNISILVCCRTNLQLLMLSP